MDEVWSPPHTIKRNLSISNMRCSCRTGCARSVLQHGYCDYWRRFYRLIRALNLAERGYDVALFEAGDLGAGASGRNGGHLCQGWSTDFDKIARQLDPAHRQMAWQAGCEAVEEVAGRIDTHQIDCGVRWGYLHAALHKKQLDEALSMLDEYEAHHYPHMTALPDRQSVARHIDSPAYIGGLLMQVQAILTRCNYYAVLPMPRWQLAPRFIRRPKSSAQIIKAASIRSQLQAASRLAAGSCSIVAMPI